MIEKVRVFYEGWGERWHWGTLLQTLAFNARPTISFEYSEEALQKGIELSAYHLPLSGPKLRGNFPPHQLQLPGPVYDALPDGWGMLLMDRLFKRQGLVASRVSPLQRLAYIGDGAMGALSFEPVLAANTLSQQDVSLLALASEMQEVLQGEGGEFLEKLLQMGGSPQGARPKVLVYKNNSSLTFNTHAVENSSAWLVKFPANHEHPEVCAIEKVYSHCLGLCGIETPESAYIDLPNGLAAFAIKRFDREGKLRVPMQTLAAFTGADYRVPGSLDYKTFLRATQACTQDVSQKRLAFERAVFNVIFNNRDDHPKNFSYFMTKAGSWQLAPAYDVTFCEGPAGYHQMDVLGEALIISGQALLELGVKEAELTQAQALAIIKTMSQVAAQFAEIANQLLPEKIRAVTLQTLQTRINNNIKALNL